MAIDAQTIASIYDSGDNSTIDSGSGTANWEAPVRHNEGGKHISRWFKDTERQNTASDQHERLTDFRTLNNQIGRKELIDNLIASTQVRAPRKISSRSGTRSLSPLMEWEGSVEGIEGDEFFARLTNVTTGEHLPTEEARFPVSELNEVQRDNLEVGAIFRWVIGLQRLPNGNKQRVSELFFRRLPAHSEKEINATVESIGPQLDAQEWDDAPSS